LAVHGVEVASDDKAFVVLHNDGVDIRRGNPGRHMRIESGIDGARGVEARQPKAGHAVDFVEQSPDQDVAIGLKRQAVDLAVGPQARIECRVELAVGREANQVGSGLGLHGGKSSAHDHLTPGFEDDGIDQAVLADMGVERFIQCPMREDSRQGLAGLAIDAFEIPADQDAAILLHRDCVHRANPLDDPFRIRIVRVGRSVRVQPPEVVAHLGPDLRELPRHQDAPVGLDCHGHADARRSPGRLQAWPRVKRLVRCAAGLDPCDPRMQTLSEPIEVACHHNPAIRLNHQVAHRVHNGIAPAFALEAGVRDSRLTQASKAEERLAPQLVKTPGDEQKTVLLTAHQLDADQPLTPVQVGVELGNHGPFGVKPDQTGA